MSDKSKEDEERSIEPGFVDGLLRARTKFGEKPATTVRIFERNNFYYCLDKEKYNLDFLYLHQAK